MIEALIAGERDVDRMADLAQRRMRVKIPQLTEAVVGRFNEHHAFLARVHLDLIDQHTAAIDRSPNWSRAIEPFRGFHDLIGTSTGIAPDGVESLASDLESELFETAEGGQSARANPAGPPRGSVGHVEVFQMSV